jgi:hypothetical protein
LHSILSGKPAGGQKKRTAISKRLFFSHAPHRRFSYRTGYCAPA